MRLLIGLVLLAECADAQTLREKAWSVWRAGQRHEAASMPGLMAELRAAEGLKDSARDSEGWAYVETLFGAIIETPGPVTLDALLPFEKGWMAEILVAVSRSAGDAANEAALLKLRERDLPDAEWSGVNDLLFAMGSKAFFEKTLAELKFSHEFRVTDQAFAICGGAVGCGDSKRRAPAGFPAITVYQLSTMIGFPRHKQAVLFEKPIRVYSEAITMPANGGEADWSDCSFHAAANDYEWRQQRYAQVMGGVDGLSLEQSEKLFHAWTTVNWRGAEQAKADMEAALDAQVEAIRGLVSHARERGLVEADGMRVRITPKVVDLRRDQAEALAGVGVREVGVW